MKKLNWIAENVGEFLRLVININVMMVSYEGKNTAMKFLRQVSRKLEQYSVLILWYIKKETGGGG